MSNSLDYYAILCLSFRASDEDIKRAYRRLAMRWHPDKNPDAVEEATEKFRNISEAYEVLSSRERRSNYDRHGFAMPNEDGDIFGTGLPLGRHYGCIHGLLLACF